MDSLKNAYRRIKALFTRGTLERELDDEMRLHIDLLAEEYQRSGVPAAEAKRRARRRFGNVAQIKEKGRDIRGAGILDDFVRDFQYAARALRRSPMFSAIVILSLAIGIGANTALFTVVDAAFVRKLPVPNPDELVSFRWISGPSNAPFGPSRLTGNFGRFGSEGADGSAQGFSSSSAFTSEAFEKFRTGSETLSQVFAFASSDANITASSDAFSTLGQLVSGNYFTALGVPAEAGRMITIDDDQPFAPPVAVISHVFWERRFAMDPAAVGRFVIVNGVPLTIVGIIAPGFHGVQASRPYPPDLTLPPGPGAESQTERGRTAGLVASDDGADEAGHSCHRHASRRCVRRRLPAAAARSENRSDDCAALRVRDEWNS